MQEKIFKRLDAAINNLDIEIFSVLFPLILDDLEYILEGLENDRNNLSELEEFENSIKIRKKITLYFAKLAKRYFKEIYGISPNYVNTKDYGLSTVAAGYNVKDGNIYYTDFGVLLSQKSDLSFLHACLHEGRHKMQHLLYETSDLLSFPPYMLRLLKENLFEDSLPENNRKFYIKNWHLMLFENDAEIFAKYEIHNIIKKLTQVYKKSPGKKIVELGRTLIKSKKVDGLLQNALLKEPFRINNEIASQIYSGSIIGHAYEMNGQPVDRIIALDKFIKSNPELQQKYPILKLLFNGTIPKSYEELMFDKDVFKENRSVEEQQKIEQLYNEIVVLDPILTLTCMFEKGEIESIKNYLNQHPTLITEYPEEIKTLNEKYGYFGFAFN